MRRIPLTAEEVNQMLAAKRDGQGAFADYLSTVQQQMCRQEAQVTVFYNHDDRAVEVIITPFSKTRILGWLLELYCLRYMLVIDLYFLRRLPENVLHLNRDTTILGPSD